jgi:hypothetical protein
MLMSVHHQPHRGRKRRAADVVGEPADAGRRAPADRQVEDLLGNLGHALQYRATAGQNDARIERLLVAGAANLVPHEVEDLLRARLQDLREDSPRHHPRPAAAHARHVNRLVFLHHCRERASALALELLGVGNRHPEADRDVAGEMVAADADHRGVPQAAALVDGDVGGAAADVDQGDAQLLLVLRQHRLGRADLLDDGVDHAYAGAVDARHQVLRRRRGAGDDVDVHLEPRPGHADGHADAVLLVDDEVLRQHVQDLAAGRQADGLGGVDRPPHVVARDLAGLAGDGDHPAAVEALDVRPGHRQVDGVDLDAGHELGLVDRALYRVHRRLEIDDDAAADAARLGDPDADDVEAVIGDQLTDDGADLRRADVEPDQIAILASHTPSRQSRSVRIADARRTSGPFAGRTYIRPSNLRSTYSMSGTRARSASSISRYPSSRSAKRA